MSYQFDLCISFPRLGDRHMQHNSRALRSQFLKTVEVRGRVCIWKEGN